MSQVKFLTTRFTVDPDLFHAQTWDLQTATHRAWIYEQYQARAAVFPWNSKDKVNPFVCNNLCNGLAQVHILAMAHGTSWDDAFKIANTGT